MSESPFQDIEVIVHPSPQRVSGQAVDGVLRHPKSAFHLSRPVEQGELGRIVVLRAQLLNKIEAFSVAEKILRAIGHVQDEVSSTLSECGIEICEIKEGHQRLSADISSIMNQLNEAGVSVIELIEGLLSKTLFTDRPFDGQIKS